MAGRPLGIRTLGKALARLSRAELKKLIAAIPSKDNRVAKLERQRKKHIAAVKYLDREIAKLSGGNGAAPVPARSGRKPGWRKGYKLSAATRRRMSLAAKRRYAGKAKSAPAQEARKKRAMSAETRAKMAAAAKARWAKVKGEAAPSKVQT